MAEDQQNASSAEYVTPAEGRRAQSGAQRQGFETAPNEEFAADCVFEPDTLDEAVELAARIPAARLGGAINVRPMVER